MGVYLRKYNTLLVTGTTAIRIPIIKRGVVDFAASGDWSPAAGDVKVWVDGTAANITNLPTAINSGNCTEWEFILTAAELSCKSLHVVVTDSASKAVEDTAFTVETFGNASAMYAADLSAANLPADAKAINGVSTSSVTTINANVGTTQPVNYTGTSSSALVKVDVQDFGGSAGTFSSGRPEVNTTHAAGTAWNSGAITSGTFATDSLTATAAAASLISEIQSGLSTLTQTQVTGGAYALNSASFAFNSALDLTTTQKASVNTEADTALSDYGALKPTTAGRTLDVSAGGEAGLDWANIGSPTTTVNLSGTTVKNATDVRTDTTSIISTVNSISTDTSIIVGILSGLTTAVAAITDSDGTGVNVSSTGLQASAGTEIATAVWANGTRTVTSAANITSTGGTTVPQTGDSYTIVNSGTHGNAALKTLIDDLPTNAELATALGTADDAVLAAIAALNNLSSAGVTSAVTTALTTALTEGYRATGATGSVRDLLYEIIGNLINFANAGTTRTVTKLNQSTTAKTYTYDDADNPTSCEETT